MPPLTMFTWFGFGIAGAISVVVPLVIEFQVRTRKRIAPAKPVFRPVLIQGGKPQAPPAEAAPESRTA